MTATQDKRRILGQVFTPPALVADMLALRENFGRALEPSAGNGAFSAALTGPDDANIELDPDLTDTPLDFFAYDMGHQFDTVIGNPPYVRHSDIPAATRQLPAFREIQGMLLDGRANLFLFFVAKCVLHLNEGGELIFVTPRDLIKSTAACRRLNQWMHDQGAFTHWTDLGDKNTFVMAGHEASPTAAVWRWVKGRKDQTLYDGRTAQIRNGTVWFGADSGGGLLGDVFDVKVGALSGADGIFEHPDGVLMMAAAGEPRRMLYDIDEPHPHLASHKEALLARRVAKITEANWWKWGRRCCHRAGPRIYVPQRTRKPQPFFVSDVQYYDGSVLALFAKDDKTDLQAAAAKLNAVDWNGLGFVAGGRTVFTQRSLANAPFSL